MPVLAKLFGFTSEEFPDLAEPSNPLLAASSIHANVLIVDSRYPQVPGESSAGTIGGYEFRFKVCTLDYIARELGDERFLFEPGLVIVREFSWATVERAIGSLLSDFEAETEEELVFALSQSCVPTHNYLE